jgi:uncharacterized protein YdbL (DUF1318 family)
MRRRYLLTGFLVLLMGLLYVSCGPTVKIQTPEPLEINVKVRIDIYNHVEAIEDSIYGDAEKKEENKEENKEKPPANESYIRYLFMEPAYGASDQDDYDAALQRRKARAQQVIKYKNEGSLGENHNGLVSLISSAKVKSDKAYAGKVKATVKEENSDRETMYKIDAAKRGIEVEVIKEETARVHRDKAKSGWWIEVEEDGNWVWKQK